jgi:hypothetical protein
MESNMVQVGGVAVKIRMSWKKESKRLLGLMTTMVAAERQLRDNNFIRSKRRVAFLRPDWWVDGTEPKTPWDQALISDDDSESMSWCWLAQKPVLSVTEVIAVVNLNPGSGLGLHEWGVVWYNREKRWIRTSWEEKVTPTMAGWKQAMEQGVTARQGDRGKWWIRYADAEVVNHCGVDESMLVAGGWMWQWWRKANRGGRQYAPLGALQQWCDRCITTPANPLQPRKVDACLRGPMELETLPRRLWTGEAPEEMRDEGAGWWVEDAEWKGVALSPPTSPSGGKRTMARILSWNVDGWNEKLSEGWWHTLLKGEIDIWMGQDLRWTKDAGARYRRALRFTQWGGSQPRLYMSPPGKGMKAGGTGIALRTSWGLRSVESGEDKRGWGRYTWDMLAGAGHRRLLTITLYAPGEGMAAALWQEGELDSCGAKAGAQKGDREVITPWWFVLTDVQDEIEQRKGPGVEVLLTGDFNFSPVTQAHTPEGARWIRFLAETGLVVVSKTAEGGVHLPSYRHGAAETSIDHVLASPGIAPSIQVGVLDGDAKSAYSSCHMPMVITFPIYEVLGLVDADMTRPPPQGGRARQRRIRRGNVDQVKAYQAALEGTPASEDGKERAKPGLWTETVSEAISTAREMATEQEKRERDPVTGNPERSEELQVAMDSAMQQVTATLAAAQKCAFPEGKNGKTTRQPDGWSPYVAQVGKARRLLMKIKRLCLVVPINWAKVLGVVNRAAALLPPEATKTRAACPTARATTECLHAPPVGAKRREVSRWLADILQLSHALQRSMQGSIRTAQRLRISERMEGRERHRRTGRIRAYLDSMLERPPRDGGLLALTSMDPTGSFLEVESDPEKLKLAMATLFRRWMGHQREREWMKEGREGKLWEDTEEGRRTRIEVAEGATTADKVGLEGELAQIFPYLLRKKLKNGHVICPEDFANLMDDFTDEEWCDYFRYKSSSTSPGLSETSVDMIRCTTAAIFAQLRQLAQLPLRTGQVFEQWYHQLLRPIPKVAGTTLAELQRPLMLLEVFRKAFGGILIKRVHAIFHKLSALEENHHAFKKNSSLDHTGMNTVLIIEDANAHYKELHAASLDIKRAYDTGERTIVQEMAMRRLGLPEAYISLAVTMDRGNLTEVVTGHGLSGTVEGGTFRTETGYPQGADESPLLFVGGMDIPLTWSNNPEEFKKNAYFMETEGDTDVGTNAEAYADDVLAISGTEEGLQRSMTPFTVSAAVFGWEWSIKKCIHLAHLPRRILRGKKKGEMEFVEEGGSKVKDIYIHDPWEVKPPQIIPFQRADVAFRYLGIHLDMWGNWGDQVAVLKHKVNQSVKTVKRHVGSSDGVSTVVNMVLRRQALFPLKFAPSLREDVEAIERPARHLWLQAQGMARTTSRPLTEMSCAQAGLGYLSWWDETHLDQLTYLLCKIQDTDKAGQLLRASLWRLRRTTAARRCPLDSHESGGEDEGTNHEWLGRLIAWMRSRKLSIRDFYLHPSPTHRLLMQGPNFIPHSHPDLPAILDLQTGYDWVVALGPRELALAPEVSRGVMDGGGVLDSVEAQKRDGDSPRRGKARKQESEAAGQEWLVEMQSVAVAWLGTVKTVMEADPGFSTSQIPVRRHTVVAWVEEGEDNVPITRLGRVMTRTAESLEVITMPACGGGVVRPRRAASGGVESHPHHSRWGACMEEKIGALHSSSQAQ